jgi:lactoylglutathione lyase
MRRFAMRRGILLSALLMLGAATSAKTTDPFRGMRPYLVAISVEHLDHSIAWYSNALGLRLVRRMGSPKEEIEVAFLECEGFRLELVELKGSVRPDLVSGNPASVRGIGKFAFQVDDLDGTVGELGRRGVSLANEFRDSATGKRSSVIVKDPDGNWVQFFQRPS